MTLRQQPAAAVQTETKGAGAGAAAEEYHFVDNGSGVAILEGLSAGNPEFARPVDWHHDGSVFELVLIGSPYKQIDDGSGNIILSQSGTAIAILVDGGDGVTLQVSTDLTQTPAGAFYDAANGDIVPVRFDDRRVRFVAIGTTITSFEDAA